MKRPVTSLCRRPGKKTACGAACPRCGNNFRPQGRSVEGRRSCRAKAARTRAQKQPRRGPGTVHRLRHGGGTAGNGRCLVLGSDRPGCPPGQGGNGGHHVRGGAGKAPHWVPAGAEGTPGRKTAPGEGRGLCVDCAHGRVAGNGVSGAGKHLTGRTPGQRARPGTKTAPGGGRRLCASYTHGGAAGNKGVWYREASHWTPAGAEGMLGHKKQPPAGAGGCLDAGYGCYLPRAIRVIWMHRVGSTARPRIMPS